MGEGDKWSRTDESLSPVRRPRLSEEGIAAERFLGARNRDGDGDVERVETIDQKRTSFLDQCQDTQRVVLGIWFGYILCGACSLWMCGCSGTCHGKAYRCALQARN